MGVGNMNTLHRTLLILTLVMTGLQARRPAAPAPAAPPVQKSAEQAPPAESQTGIIALPTPQLAIPAVEAEPVPTAAPPALEKDSEEGEIAAPFSAHQLLAQLAGNKPAPQHSQPQEALPATPSATPPTQVAQSAPSSPPELEELPPLSTVLAQAPAVEPSTNDMPPPAPVMVASNTDHPVVMFNQEEAPDDAPEVELIVNEPSSQTVTMSTDVTLPGHSKPAASSKNEYRNDRDLYIDKNQKKDVYLNFENAELKSFIDYIADIRGMNIIPDQGIAGNKISLNFRKPVSRDGAWNTFLTVLEMSNFSIVKYKNGVDADGVDQFFYRVMPKDKKLRQPLPTFIGVDYNELPDSDATIRYVSFLNNIPIQEVQSLLQNLLSKTSAIIPQQDVNGFVITDKANNIKAAMKVIKELDQTSIHETVFVMRLKRANAADVKSLFDSLIKKPDGNPLARLLGKQENTAEYFSPSTKIIAEERTNSLIMLGNQKSLEKVREFIVEHIDTDLKQAKSPLRIYELQHTSAREIEEILREVTATENFQSQAGQQAAKYGAIRGGVKYFKGMTFQSDVEGNRLLVSCADDGDWELLKKTIERLDAPQPQVAVQMMIVTVSEKRVRELGGQMRNKTHNMIGKGVDFQTHGMSKTVFEQSGSTPTSLLGNLINALVLERGSTVVNLGNAVTGSGENGMWGVFKALSTETDATVLSEPFMTIANRSSSTLVVGESTYVTTQEAVSGSNATTGYEKEDANTTITLTPQINSDGIIRMEVDASVDEFVPGTGGASKQTKKLKTNVTVANGQVLALGGMVKTKVTESGGKTPILGDIPLLGWLAKSKKRNTEKEYLFLFLCPTILKPRTTPGIGMYTKMKLHRAAGEVEDAIKTTKSNDPVQNFYFNPTGEGYSHKVIDFANARYQPNNVDIRHDPFFRSESSIEIDRRLEVASKSASPSDYWQNKRPARREKPLEKATLISEVKPQRSIAPEFPLPATQPVGPEKVTLPSAEPETQAFGLPQAPPPAPAAPQKVETPEVTKQILMAETQPQAPEHNEAYLDQQIQFKRDKLKSLLGGGSLGDLLSRVPNHQIVEDQTDAPTDTQPEAAPVMVAQAPPAPEQPSALSKQPEEAPSKESFMLTRRRGIRSFLSTPDEVQDSQPTTLGRAEMTGRQGLRSFLETQS